MPTGLEHVENTLNLIDGASEVVGALGNVGWKAAALAELASTAELLERTKDRFFLRSRLCLPFARRCEEAARKLTDQLSAMGTGPARDAENQVLSALAALTMAAKTLDERSLMQGMAIT